MPVWFRPLDPAARRFGGVLTNVQARLQICWPSLNASFHCTATYITVVFLTLANGDGRPSTQKASSANADLIMPTCSGIQRQVSPESLVACNGVS
jgi:hypothetical protein